MAISATVIEVIGRAWVRESNGSLSELRPGATLPPDGEVITASGGIRYLGNRRGKPHHHR